MGENHIGDRSLGSMWRIVMLKNWLSSAFRSIFKILTQHFLVNLLILKFCAYKLLCIYSPVVRYNPWPYEMNQRLAEHDREKYQTAL